MYGLGDVELGTLEGVELGTTAAVLCWVPAAAVVRDRWSERGTDCSGERWVSDESNGKLGTRIRAGFYRTTAGECIPKAIWRAHTARYRSWAD